MTHESYLKAGRLKHPMILGMVSLKKILPNFIDKISITIIFAPFSWVSVDMHTDKIPSRIAIASHIADINSVAEVCVVKGVSIREEDLAS